MTIYNNDNHIQLNDVRRNSEEHHNRNKDIMKNIEIPNEHKNERINELKGMEKSENILSQIKRKRERMRRNKRRD